MVRRLLLLMSGVGQDGSSASSIPAGALFKVGPVYIQKSNGIYVRKV